MAKQAPKRKQYSKEYKTEVVNLVQLDGMTLQAAGKQEGVSPEIIRRWVKEAQAQPTEAAPAAVVEAPAADVVIAAPLVAPAVPVDRVSFDLNSALRDKIEVLDLGIERLETEREAFVTALEISEAN